MLFGGCGGDIEGKDITRWSEYWVRFAYAYAYVFYLRCRVALRYKAILVIHEDFSIVNSIE